MISQTIFTKKIASVRTDMQIQGISMAGTINTGPLHNKVFNTMALPVEKRGTAKTFCHVYRERQRKITAVATCIFRPNSQSRLTAYLPTRSVNWNGNNSPSWQLNHRFVCMRLFYRHVQKIHAWRTDEARYK